MKLTLILILLNIAVFIYSLQNLNYFIQTYGFSSDSFAKGNYVNLITAFFLHKNWWHLTVNMVTLFFVGYSLEEYVSKTRYLLVYFLSGALTNLGIILLPYIGIKNIVVVGASAAISGLIGFGAFKISTKWTLSPIRFIPVPMPFMLSAALFAFMNIANISSIPSIGHITGGIIGGVFGLKGEKRKLLKIFTLIMLISIIALISTAFQISFKFY